MVKRANKKSAERTWVVLLVSDKPARRLGTVTAPDSDVAIAKAIDEFGITDSERQRRVIVRPIAEI
jgi:hypothetical protein